MGEQGVVRTNISVPRKLKARMDKAGERVNWSAVAAQAFEQKLLELESTKEVGPMEDVIERLRAATKLEQSIDYEAGFDAGETWAKKRAMPKQLRRLADYICGSEAAGSDWWDVDGNWNGPWGATGYFALQVLGLNPNEADATAAVEFWRRALGDTSTRIKDADFFHGFGDGASAVWEKVQDKL
jgi:hypothetical protein